jgi:hypothetical protein
MTNFVKALETKTDLYKLSSATVEQISNAEKSLNVKFAEEYKEYLAMFGAASASTHEFTGICQSSRLSVVDVTISERQRNSSVPLDLYVVEQTNFDRIVVWQSSTGEVYQTAPNMQSVKLCNSLCEYLDL